MSLKSIAAFVLTAAFVTVGPASTSAAPIKYSLKEKKMMKHKNKEMARYERNLNDRCKSKIKVSIDWDSYKAAGKLAPAVEGAASKQLDEIGYHVCRDADGEEAVRAAIKEIRFVWAEDDKLSHKIENSVLIETIWVKPGTDGYVVQTKPTLKAWLNDNL